MKNLAVILNVTLLVLGLVMLLGQFWFSVILVAMLATLMILTPALSITVLRLGRRTPGSRGKSRRIIAIILNLLFLAAVAAGWYIAMFRGSGPLGLPTTEMIVAMYVLMITGPAAVLGNLIALGFAGKKPQK